MDRLPIGMATCLVVQGTNHTPVLNVDTQTVECVDCSLEIVEWSIYIPERDENVSLWLSQTTITEEEELTF